MDNLMDEGIFSVCVTHHNVESKETVEYNHINKCEGLSDDNSLIRHFSADHCKDRVTV